MFKIKKPTFHQLFLGAAIFSASISSFADDAPKHGRLPDGRAYRIDQQGNELSDYIAELEVDLDTAKRQVHALQDDLQRKQELNERLEQAGRHVAPVAEKSILLEGEEFCADEKKQLAKAQKEIQRLTLEQTDRNVKLEQFQQQVHSQQSELASLQKKIAEQPVVISYKGNTPDLEEAASIRASQSPLFSSMRSEGAEPHFSSNLPLTFEEQKAKTQTEMSKLVSAVNTRDSLFVQYGARAREVQVKPTELVTEENDTVDSLKERLSRSEFTQELFLIGRRIQDLRSKAESDISFMRRFQR